MNAIDRLIGNEVDGYKQMYYTRLSQFKSGISINAIYLSSNKSPADSNYYDLINRIGIVKSFNIKHSSLEIKDDRVHFTESYLSQLTKKSKIPFFLFHNDKVEISYKTKKETISLYDKKIISGFKSNASNFFELLEKNKGKGEVVLKLIESAPERLGFEKNFFDSFTPTNLELRALDNFRSFIHSDPSYTECNQRFKIFFPELKANIISKMDTKELDSKINSINFKTVGIKTLDAYIYFLENFSNFHITNSSLLKKTNQIDSILSNYLK